MSSIYFKSNQPKVEKSQIDITYIDACIHKLEEELAKPPKMSDYVNCKKLWKKILDVVPVITCTVDPNCTILRCRPNDNDKQMFEHVDEISYIKDKSKVKLGRFNRDENPVFYGASVPIPNPTDVQCITAILETTNSFATLSGADAHKYLTIGLWRPVKPLFVVDIRFDNDHSFISHCHNNANKDYWRLKQLYTKSELEKIAEVNAFIGQLASLRENIATSIDNIYILNSAFFDTFQDVAKYKYKQKPPYVGLLHMSSKAREIGGMNIVLPTEAIDEKTIVADSVFMFKWFKEPLSDHNGRIHRCSNFATVDEGDRFTLKKITLDELQNHLPARRYH
jgi:hypothetical protein